jgi:hypothetical protein
MTLNYNELHLALFSFQKSRSTKSTLKYLYFGLSWNFTQALKYLSTKHRKPRGEIQVFNRRVVLYPRRRVKSVNVARGLSHYESFFSQFYFVISWSVNIACT